MLLLVFHILTIPFLPLSIWLISTHSLRVYFGIMPSLKTTLTLLEFNRFFYFILEPKASLNHNICSTVIIQLSAFYTKGRSL